MQRDSKNLYKKTKYLKNFSKIGLSGDYELSKMPDIVIDTSKERIYK
jgi:adenylylsulfate kinase-like enzyme